MAAAKMEAKQVVGLVAVVVAVLLQLLLGRSSDGSSSSYRRRAWAPYNGSEIEHHTEPIPRISLAEISSSDSQFDVYRSLERPFVLTELCDPDSDSADPCHLRDDTWSAASIVHRWDWAHDATAEFYPLNMDVYSVLRTAERIPLTRAVAATAGLSIDGANQSQLWPADDLVQPPRRYVHFNVANSSHWDRLMNGAGGGLLSTVAVRLPRQLRYTIQWMQEVLIEPAGSAGSALDGGSGVASQPATGATEIAADWNAVTHWRMLLIGSDRAGEAATCVVSSLITAVPMNDRCGSSNPSQLFLSIPLNHNINSSHAHCWLFVLQACSTIATPLQQGRGSCNCGVRSDGACAAPSRRRSSQRS